MRCVFSVVLVAGCAIPADLSPPPASRLYFPTGITHVAVPGRAEGMLVVASANSDRRYGVGALTAIELEGRGLPVFGAVGDGGPALQLTDLGPVVQAAIPSLAGELAAYQAAPGRWRIFVPTREQGMRLAAVDLEANASSFGLRCLVPDGGESAECATSAISLSPRSLERSAEGIPRAPAPYGVAVGPRRCHAFCGDAPCTCQCGGDGFCQTQGWRGQETAADVFVTHIEDADSPLLSRTNFRGYGVRLDATAPEVSAESFVSLDAGATNSVAIGQRWAYFTGRFVAPVANLVRLVDRSGQVLFPQIQDRLQIGEASGTALSSDEKRLYIAGRIPDSLVVLGITGAQTASPQLAPLRVIPLPAAPIAVTTLARAGRSDLVLVVCTGAGVLVLYDDEAGDVVAQVPGIGVQPFGIAVERRGAGARLYVSVFGDGRVAVVDVPSLDRPQSARLVAHLGAQQLCLVGGANAFGCDGGM